MGNSVEWQDITYKETFEEETRGLIRRRQTDSCCKVGDLEGILNSLYIMDGADWVGRGSLQDTILSARIAAYERFIAQWKAEDGNPGNL
ncbi:MAG: hypothetical protein LBV17_07125 [Treponema sp.]|jgi:hypothetical protein|nr:hypothetical protein [Treponema sp.]